MANPEISITLNVITCACGACYAVPHWVTSHTCPMCASREKTELRLCLQDKERLISKLDHQIAGLRGALKRR
jgi:hypothetical protein